jgi:hypothetical protein
LNDALTAIVFLVDERVFNKKKYPEPKYPAEIGTKELERVPTIKETAAWVKSIGGKKNVFLRNFLMNFRLA